MSTEGLQTVASVLKVYKCKHADSYVESVYCHNIDVLQTAFTLFRASASDGFHLSSIQCQLYDLLHLESQLLVFDFLREACLDVNSFTGFVGL